MGICQTPAAAKKANLLQRARSETTIAESEASGLSRYEQPLFYARLVEAWHDAGDRSLKLWTIRAVADIRKRPNDRPEQNRQRLVTAGSVLTILDPIDPDAASKVLDAMTSGLSELGDMARLTPPERAQLRPVAAALGTVAARIALTDADRAAALARTIMSLRDANALSPVLEKLRQRRPELAKTIMADAVQSAGTTLDPYFIAGIARQLLVARQKKETSYPQLHGALLQAMNAALMRTPANRLELEDSCRLARVARQFAAAVSAEPPASLNEAGERCANLRTLEDPPPVLAGKGVTSDDYLEAALTAIEARDRAAFRVQAALMLAKNDAPRALAIAGGLSDEEQKIYPEWRKVMLTIANAAVIARHEANDGAGVQQVLDTIPPALRPIVELNAATWARRQPEERTFATAMLKAARRALDKKTVDDGEMLVDLLNGYAAMIPTDAADVLDEVTRLVDAIPHPPSFWKDPAEALADLARNGTQSGPPVPLLGYELRPAKIDAEVVDITESRWDGALRRVSDKADRIALRLGLIHRLLEMSASL